MMIMLRVRRAVVTASGFSLQTRLDTPPGRQHCKHHLDHDDNDDHDVNDDEDDDDDDDDYDHDDHDDHDSEDNRPVYGAFACGQCSPVRYP